jgi:KaiC/GvpD/RAD55 family RecA-like ATPase
LAGGINADRLPEGRRAPVAGGADSVKTVLIVQFRVRGIEDFSSDGAMVTVERTPEGIAEDSRSPGWDLDGYLAEKDDLGCRPESPT